MVVHISSDGRRQLRFVVVDAVTLVAVVVAGIAPGSSF